MAGEWNSERRAIERDVVSLCGLAVSEAGHAGKIRSRILMPVHPVVWADAGPQPVLLTHGEYTAGEFWRVLMLDEAGGPLRIVHKGQAVGPTTALLFGMDREYEPTLKVEADPTVPPGVVVLAETPEAPKGGA